MQLSNFTVPQGVKYEWVDQPNQRGTIDIIWSCILVLITSVWTVMHLNVPSTNESYWRTVARKFRWAGFILLCPEMLCVLAAAQWRSAQQSVQLMHSLKIHGWTVVHGFFADSGGFLLYAPDVPPFPINTRAMHYLVSKGYINAPDISREELEDKSKADAFIKVVACIQGSYLVIQCIVRQIQGLGISPLELGTIAFVFCTAISYFFWINKPLDVRFAIPIQMATPINQVLLEAGPIATQLYSDTPMDFVEQPGWTAWRRRPQFSHWGGLTNRPIERIPNDYYPAPVKEIMLPLFLWLIVSTYGAIHFWGWYFSFPTAAEQLIWRVASIVSFVVLCGWGVVEVLTLQPWFDFQMTMLGIWENQVEAKGFWKRYGLDTAGTISAVLYFFARVLLIAEMFATLRLMQGTTYQNIDWMQYIPHL